MQKTVTIFMRLARLFDSAEKTPFTLLWFALQTLPAYMSKYSEVGYPSPIEELTRLLGNFVLDLSAITPKICVGFSWYESLLFTITWWPAIVGMWIFGTISCLASLTAVGKEFDYFEVVKLSKRIYKMVLLLLVLFHSSICTFVFNTFDCTDGLDAENSIYDGEGDDNTEYLLADMSVACSDQKYLSYRSIAVMAAVFYAIVIPSVFACILRNRASHPILASPLLFMSRELKPYEWWFEIRALVFRFTFTGVLLIIHDLTLRTCG